LPPLLPPMLLLPLPLLQLARIWWRQADALLLPLLLPLSLLLPLLPAAACCCLVLPAAA
jgi:hypothetical protein